MTTTHTQKTAVGVFETRAQAQNAVRELKDAGFQDNQIGVAARNDETASTTEGAVQEGTYAEEGAIAGALAGAGIGGLWAIGIAAGVMPVIGPAIAGGILASLLTSAAAGAAIGGLAGALIGIGVPEDEAEYYESEFASGRTIVTVQAAGRYSEATDILRRCGGYDISSRPAETYNAPSRAGGLPEDSDETGAPYTGPYTAPSSAALPGGSPLGTGTGKDAGYTPTSGQMHSTPSASYDTSSGQGAGTCRTEAGGQASRLHDENRSTVKVHEEQLQVRKQPVQTGEVRVTKEVHTEHKTLEVPVQKEEVVVERRSGSGQAASASALEEGEALRIPVTEEQVHVEKQPVVKEEVTIGKRKVQDTQRVGGTVRKEELHVESEGDVDVRDPKGRD
jgi:uncharacterized protein (TIGR02271 family)